ncbi:MAG TPA: isoleucine--tRNA ligase [Candidatus Woesebacteria bacterium]|nr:isoleucine--tRNA ligase [Candidatus Woesebacteria bacterium]
MPKVSNFRQPPNLPELEEQIVAFWRENQTFERSVNQRPTQDSYVFYDGPPFATGMPHYGHLLASTIKDVVPRFWTMKGKRVARRWGWDCHGLPIENMIEQQLGLTEGKKSIETLGIKHFNQACRHEVLRLDHEWEKIIGRLGRWVDFANNYKTMDTNYMESVWWGFQQLFQKGLVYEGKKVILYCPRCATPLSNFEIAMDNSYETITENSTYYKYAVKGQPRTYLLAWSTTPWNKLVTTALAVNPKIHYVKIKQGEENYYLAENRLSVLLDDLPYDVVDKISGEEVAKLQFELHFDFYPNRSSNEKAGVVIADEFVTSEEGTGIVTLAAYGEEDYQVMQDHHVQMVLHVDDEGRLKQEIRPWSGMDILQANPLINQDLANRGLIYKEEPHTHSVPVCYRCNTRLYYAPVPAWFIDVQSFKQKLIASNEQINWFPDHLKYGRFLNGLENAPDWNISRSRYWGTPMPIWIGYDQQGKRLMRVIGSRSELQEWAVDQSNLENLDDLHRETIDEIKVYVDDKRQVVGSRIPEVFDCWVESGSMPFASVHYPFENQDFFEHNYPAQFVSEYIAQTRAWFYTMHVMSVGIFGQHPFENVLTTGTILAEDGAKMSKSKKNFPDPQLLINQYGADSLRLYLMSSNVMKAENINFMEKDVADLRRKVFLVWWNMLSFYKMFISQDTVWAKLPEKIDHVMDCWVVSWLNSLTKKVTTYLIEYDVVRASRELIGAVDVLSTWYLRLSRERLKQNNQSQSHRVFAWSLVRLAQLFAPFSPFFSELVFHNLVEEKGSIHLTDWPQTDTTLIDEELEKKMMVVRMVVEVGRRVRLELGVKLRRPLLSATITTALSETDLSLFTTLVQEELNVKQIIWRQDKQLTEPDLSYDLSVTRELEAEAQAREIIRQLQDQRKKARLPIDQIVKAELADWPASWQAQIEQKTNTRLVRGTTTSLLLN